MLRFASKKSYAAKEEDLSVDLEFNEEEMDSELNENIFEEKMETLTRKKRKGSEARDKVKVKAKAKAKEGGEIPRDTLPSPSLPVTEISPLSNSAVPIEGFPAENRLQVMRSLPSRPQKKVRIRKANSNVFSLALGFLGTEVQLLTGDPIICKCGAALDKFTRVSVSYEELELSSEPLAEGSSNPQEPDDPLEKFWCCNFCLQINSHSFEWEEVPSQEIADFVLEGPANNESLAIDGGDSSLVFALDISGSMCQSQPVEGKINLVGDTREKMSSLYLSERDPQFLPNERQDVTYVSRLQSVQAAVDAQISTLAKENPNCRVAILTFNNEVVIYGDGSQTPITVTGERLKNFADLQKVGLECPISGPLSASLAAIKRQILQLEESGSTALGPAALIGICLAGKKAGSKVIICTDGMANVGVGRIDDPAVECEAEKFYEELAALAQSKSLIVSILTIKGSEAGLKYLTTLAQSTDGTVDIVDPLDIESSFSNILKNKVVATNVSFNLFLDPIMYTIDPVSGEKGSSKSQREVGSALEDTEVSIEYGVNPTAKARLPVQAQVLYTRLDGSRCLRVISTLQEITLNLDDAEQNADLEVLSSHSSKVASKMASEGDYERARWYNASQSRYHGKRKEDFREFEQQMSVFQRREGDEKEHSRTLSRKKSRKDEDEVYLFNFSKRK